MQTSKTNKNPIIGAVAAISLNFAAATNAVADDRITFENPYRLGPNKTVTLDCAPLRERFTCGFAEQLDGQEICDDDKILSQSREKRPTEAEAQKLAGNLSMIATIYHNGVTHKHCTSQYALTLINSIVKDTDRKVKTDQQFSAPELDSIKTRLRDLSRVQVNGSIDPTLRNETEELLDSVSEKLIRSLEEDPNDYMEIMHTLIPVLKDRERWRALDECKPLEAVAMCKAELGM